ncbi:MAG: transglycosylase SLT domain-containing protein [Aliarcobacter skirrowii]|uniref:transglycosylase SLT domain-containing protein n=1 Tax=Aliarcobacter skirrowii TaxID=28200 RepID=UPI00242C7BB8|nr:transglycosylase SLT domain-containing protein [Aliarcobacter skirrowii]MDD2508018.1 transglycosylase SLT domain-containing protein [Aliarcobacter skirrowii]MDD3496294.1 transglycosylase SLT domain-containing protein [Aliarcobacter skirrowii]
MKIKFLILTFLLTFNVFTHALDLKNLTPQQLEMLREIKKMGKDSGLSYSLMAIAIKESKLGAYMINISSKDFGIYQANITTVLNRQNIRDTSWNRNVFASKLVFDFEFATQNAIEELTFWKKVHKNDWHKVWGSYNAGYRHNSKKARTYSREIASIIRELKKINV